MIERFAIATAQFRAAVVLVCLMGTIGFAQTTDPGAANPPNPPANPTYTPLTGSDRLHGYLHSLYGPMSLVSGAVSAAWGQWNDRPEEWPQGAEGYGKRFASGYGQRFVRETLTFGASSLLHEDNRYVHSTSASKGGRLKHALISTFTARKDDGSTTFAYARIGGMFGGSVISRVWQPRSTASMTDAAMNFSTSLGVAAGFNLAREFLPRRFRFGK